MSVSEYSEEMAVVNPDNIHKALRLVPDFDGNANILTRFIKICDRLCAEYLRDDPDSELNNLCLLNGILNKITGPAATIINSNGIPETWLGIRNVLVNNFADQRDETALYNDLSLATQGHSSPQAFYEHCQTLFSTIMTYVTLHESIPTTIEAKRTLYKKLAMQAFVRGLREPIGSRIRCMRPDSIEKALEYVQEELNIQYLQQRNESVPRHHIAFRTPPAQPTGFLMSKPFNYNVPNINSQAAQRFIPPPPPQRSSMQPQPFRFNPPVNTHAQPHMSRTQQIFSTPPPRYNPQSNTFRLPPRPQPQYQQPPKPMSGVQHYVPKVLPPTLSGHDWRRSGNPAPNNYFKSREVNFNECAYDSPYYTDYYYDSEPYNDLTDYYNHDYSYDHDNRVQYYEPTDNTAVEIDNEHRESSSTEQDFQQSRPSDKLK
jgi:hypothetical protein